MAKSGAKKATVFLDDRAKSDLDLSGAPAAVHVGLRGAFCLVFWFCLTGTTDKAISSHKFTGLPYPQNQDYHSRHKTDNDCRHTRSPAHTAYAFSSNPV